MRLVGMIIKPLKDADYSLVELRGERPTPHCKKHGAMNKFTPEIWRCCSTYKFEKVAGQSDKHPGKFKENNCLAGCEEVLNTSSSNDAHTKTDARFGGSGADDVLCADVPSSPKEEQLPSCPDGVAESAVSDQDGAKPSTSNPNQLMVEAMGANRKCTGSSGSHQMGGDDLIVQEGGKPSTSIPNSIVLDVFTEKGIRADERRKVLDEVEARIVFLEDAKKRYSTSSRHACDLLIREHRFMLGAMRK